MKGIVKSLGLTTIIVTHDQARHSESHAVICPKSKCYLTALCWYQEEAFDFADEVVVFNKGSIEQIGTPNEIRDSPASPFVLSFVGDTQIVPANCQVLY